MTTADELTQRIPALQKRLVELDRERISILADIAKLEQLRDRTPSPAMMAPAQSAPTIALSNAEKIALFRSLFRGRDDVFPRRWEKPKTGKSGYSPVCRNEWARGICEKPRIKCSDCPNQAFVPVTVETLKSHLQGRDIGSPQRGESYVAGVYAMTADEMCWFLAADFDKKTWQRDALEFVATSREKRVPAALERSRSGTRPDPSCEGATSQSGGSLPDVLAESV